MNGETKGYARHRYGTWRRSVSRSADCSTCMSGGTGPDERDFQKEQWSRAPGSFEILMRSCAWVERSRDKKKNLAFHMGPGFCLLSLLQDENEHVSCPMNKT